MKPIRLSHIAIACPEIDSAIKSLRILALSVEKVHDVPSEKVRAAMVCVAVSDNFRIELLEPTAPDSPISKFLTKRSDGGIHHVSFEVTELEKWQATLVANGLDVLPPGIRKAARGRALFIHPKSMGGVLIELEEISH